MNLLTFEFKKVFFNKKFVYLMLLLIAGIAFLFLRNVVLQPYVEKEARQIIDAQTRVSQENLRMHRTVLEKDPDNIEQKKLQQINIQMLDQLYDLASIASKDEWEERLALQNEIYANTIAYKNEGGDNPLSLKEINNRIALNEQLLKEGIQPEHATYSVAMPNFMKQIVDLFIHFGALIFLFLMIGETLSSEYEQHSINLLFTQPLKKTQIIMSKFWSSVVLYVLMTGILLLTTAVIGLLFGEKGTFNYPVLVEKNGTIEFISLASYLEKGILLVSIIVIMMIPLYLLYSLLMKQTLGALAVLLGTLLVGYALSMVFSWPIFAWLNPFLNLLPSKMILEQNEQLWYQAIPISLVLTVLFYWVARQKIKTSKIK